MSRILLSLGEQFSRLKLLFYPSLCPLCEVKMTDKEKICTGCLSKIPLTYNWSFPDNIVYEKIQNKCVILHGASLMEFEEGNLSQRIIHLIKYKNRKDLGFLFGRFFGAKLTESPYFRNIDCVIALPLHPFKERKRGYNQSYYIAKGVSEGMNVPLLEKAVCRVVNNPSQTLLSAEDRVKNTENIFRVVLPESLRGKNVLIIDDVCTTGSTVSSLINEINQAVPDCKVSVALLATV